MNDATPWYRSPVYIAQVVTIVSTLTALFPQLGRLLHLVSQSDVKELVEAVFTLVALVAGIVGERNRRKSQLQPITLTAHAAAVHPATVEAERARMAAETESGAKPSIPRAIAILLAALLLALLLLSPQSARAGDPPALLDVPAIGSATEVPPEKNAPPVQGHPLTSVVVTQCNLIVAVYMTMPDGRLLRFDHSSQLTPDQLLAMAYSATRSERVEVDCNGDEGAVGYERHDPI